MTTERPPTIDPRAAQRWQSRARTQAQTQGSPWLHEEVARRMQERLDWIVRKPASWLHWEPQPGGLLAQAQLRKRYPKAVCYEAKTHEEQASEGLQLPVIQPAKSVWWKTLWRKPASGPTQGVEMLWANMALHMAADPAGLIAQWHASLAVDGFVMFSCLGPDTLRELRAIYAAQGWPAPAHEFTDMHDWGDMLVAAGFAEPVMDMERIELTFETPARALQELRELGRNLSQTRFAGLRGRGWLAKLHAALAQGLRQEPANGRLSLSFEVVYGHAFKPAPRLTLAPQTVVSLDQMRQALNIGGLKP